MPDGKVQDDGDPGQLQGVRIGLIKPKEGNCLLPFNNGNLRRTPVVPPPPLPIPGSPNDSGPIMFNNNDAVKYDLGAGIWEGWAINVVAR